MKYIPLTTRVQGPSRKLQTKFPPHWFMAQAQSTWTINRGGKLGSVQIEKMRSINICYILCVCWVWEWFLFMRNGFKFLAQVKSKTSQFETVKWILSQMSIKQNSGGMQNWKSLCWTLYQPVGTSEFFLLSIISNQLVITSWPPSIMWSENLIWKFPPLIYRVCIYISHNGNSRTDMAL